VDQHFKPDEIEIVGDEAVVVVAPKKLSDLLKVMRRAYRGAAENRARAGAATTSSTMRDVARLGTCGLPGVLDAMTYVFIAVAARVYVLIGRNTRWERDESSRALAP